MTDGDTTLPRIAILGAGNMGGAILAGLTAPGVRTGGVAVTNRSAAKAAGLRGPEVVSLAIEEDPRANLAAVEGAGVVLLGVKPYGILELLDEVAPALEPGSLVVSLAAGVRCAAMEARVANPVVRSMPNTPATVGLGVTGLAAGSRAGAAELAIARAVFATVGEVVEVPEAQLDALSAFSGSGPAYVFFLIEQLELAALTFGFTAAEAATMVRGTVRGAAELLAASGEEPAELRRRVTSPKGTTERAIAVLEAARLDELFGRAAAAAVARAAELAAG